MSILIWLSSVLVWKLLSTNGAIISPIESNQLSDGKDLYETGCDQHYYRFLENHVKNEKKSQFVFTLLKNFRSKPLKVSFHLFTHLNPNVSQQLIIGNVTSLRGSNFNSSLPTRFIIHGFCNCLESEFCKQTKSAQLRRQNCNVVSIEWPSGTWLFQYFTIRSRIEPASDKVAAMIDFLHAEAELDLGQLYLIGHSLGAHLSGLAAKKVKSGKISTIVGLDPAKPLFYFSEPNDRLAETDADNVEVIHTDGSFFGVGFYDPIGTVDFYPNGGLRQPGCGLFWGLFDFTCSHARAWEYYVESIVSEVAFWSTSCQELDQVSPSGCQRHDKAKMVKMGGEPIEEQSRGILTVLTWWEAPFALRYE